MQPTQKDIAGRLGVSRSLVSRALRGTAASIRANPATVRRIRDEARRMGYSPSAAALALRGEPTRTIGVVVKNFGDPFFGQMLSELDRLARRSGFSLVMSGVEKGRGSPGESALLTRYRPDGLLLLGSDFMPDEVRRRVADGLRVVRLGIGERVPGVAQVAMDEWAGMATLVRYLCNLGHERMGYLAVPDARSRRREAALRRALQTFDLPPLTVARLGRAKTPPWDLRPDSGAPSAWIGFDDQTALHAIAGWRQHGVGIPDAISVTGVDDIPAAALVTPGLSTLRQPVHALVRKAFKMLTQSEGVETVWIVPALVKRHSCVSIKREGIPRRMIA